MGVIQMRTGLLKINSLIRHRFEEFRMDILITFTAAFAAEKEISAW